MERKYRYYRNRATKPLGYGKLPLLEVRLSHDEHYIDLDCLVDSGAVDSMFHKDVADELGIDLQGLQTRDYFAVDGGTMTGQIALVRLQVKGLPQSIELEVAFVEANEIPIIGQSGFFDSYEVRFQRFKGRFEIMPLVEGETHKYLM